MDSNPNEYDVNSLIGARIRAAREAKGVSQRVFAKKIGMSYNKIFTLEQGKTRMLVSDLIEIANGLGISPKDRRDLFKPFQRGSRNAASGVGGIGLGLALARRWTRLVSGSLELVDRPERRGACFPLTLPARPGPWYTSVI